jgi:HAD superfamily hydrolase (TIGR01509 family)
MQGLIFDFDGLIVDTELAAFQTWQEVYHEHGCVLPLSIYAQCIGSPGAFDTHAHLESQLGRSLDRTAIKTHRRQRYVEMTQGQDVLPGVREYLDEAKQYGLKLAVASSSAREWVAGHLVRFGLDGYFDAVRCSDDAKRVKPDPELYQLALSALDLSPDQAIAFEDSPHGVTAAQRAGLVCVAVPNAVTSQLSLDHADLCLASFADLSLGQLLERVKRVKQKPVAPSSSLSTK